MSAFTNASPQVVIGGINDKSRGNIPRAPLAAAQHMPLLRLFTETGSTATTLVDNDNGPFTELFGSKSLDRRGKFHNLQTLAAETLMAEGNPFFVKRLKPDDAPDPARLIVAIEIVPDLIPKKTEIVGGFDYPGDSEPAPGDPVETVSGYRAKIVLIRDNETPMGEQQVVDGSMVAEDGGEQAQLYPLYELDARFFGSPGNLTGLRMWSPLVTDSNPFDQTTADEFETRMYRMQFLRRPKPNANPVTVKTVRGEDYIDLCFTPGTYSESTDVEYYAPEVATQAYEDDGAESGLAPVFAPFSQMAVYQSNIEAVQQMVYEAELQVNPAATAELAGPGQVDIFTGIDTDGERHHALVLEGPLNGGVYLGRNNTVYAAGGGDGDTSLESYETLVNRENLNFGELDDMYDNIAKYPFTQLYDTGLSMDGKYQMIEVLGKRKDLRVSLTTYVEAEGRAPTVSEEVSREKALMTRMAAFPESTLNGTPVCRGEIILQTGQLAGGGYRKPVPLILDYMQRWAQMAGAGNGAMREGADLDDHPNNMVELVKNLNVEFFNDRTQNEIWTSGGTWAQSFDRRSNYYPGIRSVYNDDTSVLLSPITVHIACDAMRKAYRVHSEFTGNSKLTKQQFIERVDARITELTDGIYNERVQIVPETYFTPNDDQRGFSWHCKISIYANNPRTVMVFDVETYRMEDFNNG